MDYDRDFEREGIPAQGYAEHYEFIPVLPTSLYN